MSICGNGNLVLVIMVVMEGRSYMMNTSGVSQVPITWIS